MTSFAGCNNSSEFRYFETEVWSPSALPKLAIFDQFPTFFGPSTTYEGIWLHELETDYFVEGLEQHKSQYDRDELDTWIDPKIVGFLIPKGSLRLDFSYEGDRYLAYAAKVKFIGRRNLFPTIYGFGHLGTSNRAIVVEKIIFIQNVDSRN